MSDPPSQKSPAQAPIDCANPPPPVLLASPLPVPALAGPSTPALSGSPLPGLASLPALACPPLPGLASLPALAGSSPRGPAGRGPSITDTKLELQLQGVRFAFSRCVEAAADAPPAEPPHLTYIAILLAASALVIVGLDAPALTDPSLLGLAGLSLPGLVGLSLPGLAGPSLPGLATLSLPAPGSPSLRGLIGPSLPAPGGPSVTDTKLEIQLEGVRFAFSRRVETVAAAPPPEPNHLTYIAVILAASVLVIIGLSAIRSPNP